MGGEAGRRQDPSRPRALRSLVRQRRCCRPSRPGLAGAPLELLLDALVTGRRPRSTSASPSSPTRPAPDERVPPGLRGAAADLTRLAPSVVVFDDLHWADSESVVLFERLAEPGSGPSPADRHLPARCAQPPPPGRRAAPTPRAPSRGHPPPPRSAHRSPTSARSSPRSTDERRRSGSSRRCTPAPAATRSSSRSCWRLRARATLTSWCANRSRGAWRRSCAASSRTSSR